MAAIGRHRLAGGEIRHERATQTHMLLLSRNPSARPLSVLASPRHPKKSPRAVARGLFHYHKGALKQKLANREIKHKVAKWPLYA